MLILPFAKCSHCPVGDNAHREAGLSSASGTRESDFMGDKGVLLNKMESAGKTKELK